jgi:hypothetical protein
MVVPAADAAPAPAQLSPYELQRAARIARNQVALAALGVKEAVAAVRASPAAWRRTKGGDAADTAAEAVRRPKRQAPAEAEAPAAPARSSRRIQVRAGLAEAEPDGASLATGDEDTAADAGDYSRLLTVDEYLERSGLPKGASALCAYPLFVRRFFLPPMVVETGCAPARSGAACLRFRRRLRARRPRGADLANVSSPAHQAR